MSDHDLVCVQMWFKHLNAAAAFTVRRHLSAVIFIKLRHSQPLALHRSLSHTRRTGVSSQNRCSPFELDSECGKSDYWEGKLDSDVKGLKPDGAASRVLLARAHGRQQQSVKQEEKKKSSDSCHLRLSLPRWTRAWVLTRCSATEQDDTSAENMASYLQVRPPTPLFSSVNLATLSGCGWERQTLFWPECLSPPPSPLPSISVPG